MMAQENQGTTSATPESLPVKRKRGRPRKDGTEIGSVRVPKVAVTPTPRITPAPAPAVTLTAETLQRSQRRRTDPPAGNTDDCFVGQRVEGVLDGSFEAGYLLTVRVGDTGPSLKGVVFRPGFSVPISEAEKDLAPHLSMVRRVQVPIPLGSPLNQVHGSTSHSAQKNERPVDRPQPNSTMVTQPVGQATKVAPSQLQTSQAASEDVHSTKQVPEVVSDAMQVVGTNTQNAVNVPTEGHSGDANDNNQPNNQAPSAREVTKGSNTAIVLNNDPQGENQIVEMKLDQGFASISQVNNQAPPSAPQVTEGSNAEIVLNNASQGEGQIVEMKLDQGFASISQANNQAPLSAPQVTKGSNAEIVLNNAPQGENQIVQTKLDQGIASISQAPKVVSPEVVDTGPSTEPLKTLQDEPQTFNSTVPTDAPPVESKSILSNLNHTDSLGGPQGF